MKIELRDMDYPYIVATDTNADGKAFVRLGLYMMTEEQHEDAAICLDRDGLAELIRVLNFISKEL